MNERCPEFFDPIDIDETDWVEFDFTAWTGTPTPLITGTPVVTAEVHAGVDPAPATMLIGAAIARPSGRAVAQRIQGAVRGVSYLLRCEVTIDGEQHVLAGIIKVKKVGT